MKNRRANEKSKQARRFRDRLRERSQAGFHSFFLPIWGHDLRTWPHFGYWGTSLHVVGGCKLQVFRWPSQKKPPVIPAKPVSPARCFVTLRSALAPCQPLSPISNQPRNQISTSSSTLSVAHKFSSNKALLSTTYRPEAAFCIAVTLW